MVRIAVTMFVVGLALLAQANNALAQSVSCSSEVSALAHESAALIEELNADGYVSQSSIEQKVDTLSALRQVCGGESDQKMLAGTEDNLNAIAEFMSHGA